MKKRPRNHGLLLLFPTSTPNEDLVAELWELVNSNDSPTNLSDFVASKVNFTKQQSSDLFAKLKHDIFSALLHNDER
jgi:hypothetical protein